ncbi:MAG: hypothetical protein H6Q31_213 [Bacteroidetes bacterium]|jgi:hypothetical protein|nr:hypothetical protein [Bacteroidota bacterium]
MAVARGVVTKAARGTRYSQDTSDRNADSHGGSLMHAFHTLVKTQADIALL